MNVEDFVNDLNILCNKHGTHITTDSSGDLILRPTRIRHHYELNSSCKIIDYCEIKLKKFHYDILDKLKDVKVMNLTDEQRANIIDIFNMMSLSSDLTCYNDVTLQQTIILLMRDYK